MTAAIWTNGELRSNNIPHIKVYYIAGGHVMKRKMIITAAALIMLTGCATTSTTASSSGWSAKSVGQGMQIGAAGSSGNPLSGIVWGIGFLVEQVGGAIESTPTEPEQLPEPEK